MPHTSIEQSHRGFHYLESPQLDLNPARWKAEVVARECKGEIDLNLRRIGEVAEILASHDFTLPRWDFSAGTIPLYPQFQDKEELLRYFLILSSINYEYFHLDYQDEKGEALRFKDGALSGAELATSRITQHWETLKDPQFLSELPRVFAEDVLFRAEVPIPRLGNRVDCLRAVGSLFLVLQEEGRSLTSVFEDHRGNALQIARFVADWVVGFKDEYLKRAQLYPAMVAGRFGDRADNPLDSKSYSALTIIADYRVPQTMIGWGMLEISDNLREHLQRRGVIREDSLWGQGLRAMSIVACDRFVERVNEIRRSQGSILPPVTSIHADPVIWAVPRQYQKAIAKGDGGTIRKLKELFIPGAEIDFPRIPTILL